MPNIRNNGTSYYVPSEHINPDLNSRTEREVLRGNYPSHNGHTDLPVTRGSRGFGIEVGDVSQYGTLTNNSAPRDGLENHHVPPLFADRHYNIAMEPFGMRPSIDFNQRSQLVTIDVLPPTTIGNELDRNSTPH